MSDLPIVSVRDAEILVSTLGVTRVRRGLDFMVELSAPAPRDVLIDFRTLPGSAAPGTVTTGGGIVTEGDYVAQSGTLTIAAGQTSGVISVPVNGNRDPQPDKDLVLELSNVREAAFAGNAHSLQARGVILDPHDTDLRPSLFVSAPRVLEGDSGTTQAVFDIRLSRPFEQEIALGYTTMPRTAETGLDFLGASGELVFLPGQTSSTVSIGILGDTLPEPDETFDLLLAGSDLRLLRLAPGPVSATIRDDDAGSGALPVMGLRDAEVMASTLTRSANQRALDFIVELTAPAPGDVTVAYRTLAGTAMPGTSASDSDFVAQSGTLTIAAGKTAGVISVPAWGNAEQQPDKTFTLELFNPTGAVLAGAATGLAATGTILDPTPPAATGPLRLSAESVVLERPLGGTAEREFLVTLNLPSGLDVLGSYEILAGTGAAGVDFIADSGSFVIPKGETSAGIPLMVRPGAGGGDEVTAVLRVFDVVNAQLTGGAGETFGIATLLPPSAAVSPPPGGDDPTPPPAEEGDQAPDVPRHRPTAQELEFMARVVAYGHQTEISGLGWNTADYEVSEIFLEPGRTGADPGFLAVAVTSPRAEPILAIRGTAGGDDWIDNLNPQGVGAGQVARVWDRLDAWMQDQTDDQGQALPIHLTGHSQGGAQAQLIATLATASNVQLGQVVTFNSPGLPVETLHGFDTAHVMGVRHFVSSSDPVSLVGEGFLPGDVTLYTLDLPEVLPFSGLQTVARLKEHLVTNLGSFVLTAHTGHWAQPGMEAGGFVHSAIAAQSATGRRTVVDGFDAGTLSDPDFGYQGYSSPNPGDGMDMTLGDLRFAEFAFAFRQGLAAVADWALAVTLPNNLISWGLRRWQDIPSDQTSAFRAEAQEIREFALERSFLSRTDWTEGAALLGGSALFDWVAQQFLLFDGAPEDDLVVTLDPESGGKTITYDGSDPGVLISSLGVVEMYSFAPGSAFFAGPQSEVITMTGGGNVVIGGAEAINGDSLRGFSETDLITTLDAAYGLDRLSPSIGSAILSVDTTGDGTQDMIVRLEGDYDLDQFGVMPAPGGTGIFYRAPPVELLAAIGGAVADRAGAPLADVGLQLDRPFGNVPVGSSDGQGTFVFDVLVGTEGHLQAALEAMTDGPPVTTASALETLRMAVGLAPSWGPAGPMDFIAADFNGDGQVTTADALGILRVAVGLPAEHAPRWLFVDSDADLSAVSRSNALPDPNLRLDPVTASISDLSLTGILVGHVQEYA